MKWEVLHDYDALSRRAASILADLLPEGPAGEGFFRIALTVGADRLRLAAARLGRTLQELHRGELAPAS